MPVISQLDHEMKRRQKLADYLQKQADGQVVKSHSQGLAKVLSSALGGYQRGKANDAQEASDKARQEAMQKALDPNTSREDKLSTLAGVPEYQKTVIEAGLKQDENKSFTLGAGQTRYGSDGNVIAQAESKPNYKSVAGVGLVDISDPENPRVIMGSKNKGTKLTVGENGAITFSEGYGQEGKPRPTQLPTKEQIAGGVEFTTDQKRGFQAQQEVLKDSAKKEQRDKQLMRSEGNIIQDIGRGISQLEGDKKGWSSGMAGYLTKGVPATPAYNLDKMIESVKSNISINELQAMREGSPTGGALGQVPVQQQEYLMQLRGSLQIPQDKDVLMENMKRVWNTSMDIAHGSPEEIEGLIQTGQIDRVRGEELKQRYELGFDEFGRPAQDNRNNLQSPQDITPAPLNQQAPEGIDSALWQHLTPEERALWQ